MGRRQHVPSGASRRRGTIATARLQVAAGRLPTAAPRRDSERGRVAPGPVAQWQSRGLLILVSWVRIPAGPPAFRRAPYRGTVPDNTELIRGRPRRERRSAGGIPRLPWRRIVNRFRPVEILSADHVEAIHEAGLRILRDVGVEVLGGRAIDHLER